MFVYGTNDFGQKRCDGNGINTCECYCQDATEDYSCMGLKNNDGFLLYEFKKVSGASGMTYISFTDTFVFHYFIP